jgi:hypothetical protein
VRKNADSESAVCLASDGIEPSSFPEIHKVLNTVKPGPKTQNKPGTFTAFESNCELHRSAYACTTDSPYMPTYLSSEKGLEVFDIFPKFIKSLQMNS